MPSSLVKPTMNTQFHIDYDWWEQSGKEFRLVLRQLCEEYGAEKIPDDAQDVMIDWVDPVTAQVVRVTPLMYIVLTQCSQHPEYITDRTSLVEAVFRALLASGNRPMTPIELAERTGRPAETILRTLSGRSVYKGIRPVFKATL